MTTNTELVAKWHAEKPEFTANFTARDWDTAELVAAELDADQGGENVACDRAAPGYYCTLHAGHEGACIAYAEP